MTYHFTTDVPRDEFIEFCNNHPDNHFMKSAYYGDFKSHEDYENYLCGVYEGDTLIATALVQFKYMLLVFGSFGYVPYGYNVDYENIELFNFLNNHVISFCKQHKVSFLRIDPNVMRLEHSKEGLIVEDGFNNEHITSNFINMGFKHLGYKYGVSGNWRQRFSYILDLSPSLEEVYKGIKRESVHHQKNVLRDIEVKEVGKEGLQTLYDAGLEKAIRDGFRPFPYSYFENLYDSFGENVHLYLATSNLSKAYKNIENEIEDIEKQLQTETLKPGRRNELSATIVSLQKELEQMKAEGYDKKGEVALGCKLIVQLGPKVWNVNMYTHRVLPNFRIAFALHRKAIADSKARGATSYDFEGISGSLDKNDPYYGLYEFKKSFGGDFVEYLGEFDYVFKPRKYRWFINYSPYIRGIRRRFFRYQVRRLKGKEISEI